jgi:Domain of unknown function (DUF4266)
MNTPWRSSCLLLLAAVICLPASGCVRVKPWQRATLADPIMQSDRDPLGDALKTHVFFSREASSGGASVGGGGCGCN